MSDFEKKIAELVNNYISDEDHRDFLKEFLLEDMNAGYIGALYVECEEHLEDV